MNKELKIDEKKIIELSMAIDNLIKTLTKLKKDLLNKDEDIFDRYWSFCILDNIYHTNKWSLKQGNNLLVSGFNISHKFLNTKNAKENGWSECRLNEHNFFVNELENELDDLFEKLKEKLFSEIEEE